MWEQLKKKLKQLWEEDTASEEEAETSSYKQKDSDSSLGSVHTRMSYQYPKEKSFKFPMIPDVSSPSTGENRPAYKRRERKPQDRPEVEPEKQQNKIIKSERSAPFKASEVPSPIYGFRPFKREKEKTVDVPAHASEAPSFFNSPLKEADRIVGMDLDNIEHTEPVAEVWSVSEQESQPQQFPEQEIVEMKEEENQEQQETELQVDKEEKTEDKGNIEASDESALQNHSVEQGKEQEVDSREQLTEELLVEERRNTPTNPARRQHKGTSPFNVVMTPRDKRNQLRDRKKQNSEKKQQVNYCPPFHLLNDPVAKTTEDREWVEEQIELLETTLKHFNVNAKVVAAMRGPSVTRFEVQPDLGVKVSKIKNLSDDIKLNMAAKDIRMEAPIPGKNAIGIEVPNPVSQPVGLQEILTDSAFQKEPSPLSVALGLDIAGKPIVTNLKKMPHGLIAGATGSGKSVCINSILISLLYKASHRDVRFLLIDPKMVELAPYNALPHLVSPVITDVKAATSALKWAVGEMEERYERFVKEGVRDVERYNQKMEKQSRVNDHMPYLVIVIDELADLMMVSPQDVEDSICRIAQKARACGIHLLVATQRPSVDVITGLIKANIPTRVAFSVSSQVDSRTIIDTNGAEKLLGKGDMLFLENGTGQSVRIQGAFVSDEEVERVTNYVKKFSPPQYLFEQEELLEQVSVEEEEDELFSEAVEFVVSHNGASASLLQRRFKIGYNRAARLVDNMESKGIISEQKGSKPRDVLITGPQLDEYLHQNNNH